VPTLQVGDTVLLVPGHCDPTTNLHDFMVFYRNTMVEHVEAINGRGPGY
jgi:D-serine deaminase-like pyridoxal phosphate-dependent protein